MKKKFNYFTKYLPIYLDLKLELVSFGKEIEEYSNLKKLNLKDFKVK